MIQRLIIGFNIFYTATIAKIATKTAQIFNLELFSERVAFVACFAVVLNLSRLLRHVSNHILCTFNPRIHGFFGNKDLTGLGGAFMGGKPILAIIAVM